MKVLIFGKGYIGSAYFNSGIFEEARFAEADITRPDEITEEIQKYNPEAVINCAGKTGLEWCRDNKLGAILSNIVGPLNLLAACIKKNIFFIHLGSGCIFEGNNGGRGYDEEDKPSPQCFYAYTKALADELLTRERYDKLLILRLRQPFSGKPHPRNLITKVLGYEKLINSQNSMTYVPDLILATKFLFLKKASGIFNVVNNGTISPYEIATLAKSAQEPEKTFAPISKEELDMMDKKNNREKRVDAVLDGRKLAAAGFKIADVRQRFEEALKGYKI